MPNHITTKIKYHKGSHKAVTDRVKSYQPEDKQCREFDFERLIPTPTHIYHGDLGKEHEDKHGESNCWYKWNIFNWGTKWNCYDVKVEEGEIQFDTAWSLPLPILRQLSMEFPDLQFEILSADEDIGSHCHHFYINKTDISVIKEYTSQSDEAIKFACDVKGRDYEEYIKERDEN